MTIVKTNSCKKFAAWLKRSPDTMMLKLTAPVHYFSDACVRAMGIDPAAQGLKEHAEAIEHIGDTKCWVSDLEEAWTREIETARTLVQRADAYMVMEREFAAPKQAVWDLVTSPQHHARSQRSDGVGAATQGHLVGPGMTRQEFKTR